MKTLYQLMTVSLLSLALGACGENTFSDLVDMASSSAPAQQETQQAVVTTDEAIITLTTAMDTQGLFDNTVKKVTPLFQSSSLNSNGEQAKAMLEQFRQKFAEVAQYQRGLLTQEFSDEELKAISAFVATEAGYKFVRALPDIQQRTQDYAMEQSSNIIANVTGEQPAYGSLKSGKNQQQDHIEKLLNPAE